MVEAHLKVAKEPDANSGLVAQGRWDWGEVAHLHCAIEHRAANLGPIGKEQYLFANLFVFSQKPRRNRQIALESNASNSYVMSARNKRMRMTGKRGLSTGREICQPSSVGSVLR